MRISAQLSIAALTLIAGVLTVQTKGQYCLPIFSGAGFDAWHSQDPYLMREGRPDLFKYGPIWSIILIPLSALPDGVAPLIWYFINAGAFWWACVLYKRILADQEARFTLMELLLLFPLLLTNGFYGQINSLLLLLIVLSMRAHPSPAAGVWLGAATWMKLFPGFLILLWLKSWKEWTRPLLGVLVSAVLGCVLPMFVWGPQVFQSWIATLTHDVNAPHHKLGLLSLLLSHDMSLESAKMIQRIFAVGFFGGVFLLPAYQRPLAQALAIAGFLFFSHMTEPPTLALLAPSVLFLSHSFRGKFLPLSPLFIFLFLLPSDLTPKLVKEALGGQYAIKTYGILSCIVLLVYAGFLDRLRRTPGRTSSPG